MRICQCEACGFCTDLSQAYGGYPCLPRQLPCSQRLVQGKPGNKRTRLVISALLYYFMHLELRGTANTGNLIRKKRPSIDTGRFPSSTYGNPSAFLSPGGTHHSSQEGSFLMLSGTGQDVCWKEKRVYDFPEPISFFLNSYSIHPGLLINCRLV